MNLAKLTAQELRSLQRDIEVELQGRRKQDLKKARQEVRELTIRYGISLADLTRGESAARKARAVMYQDPSNPQNTWSGRGRKPTWVKSLEAQGKALADLRA